MTWFWLGSRWVHDSEEEARILKYHNVKGHCADAELQIRLRHASPPTNRGLSERRRKSPSPIVATPLLAHWRSSKFSARQCLTVSRQLLRTQDFPNGASNPSRQPSGTLPNLSSHPDIFTCQEHKARKANVMTFQGMNTKISGWGTTRGKNRAWSFRKFQSWHFLRTLID